MSDPTGLYECNGSKEQCGAVSAALGRAKEAASNMKEGSTEQKNLNTVLAFIGAAGEKNGVNINFSDSVAGANANLQDDGRTVDITLNSKFGSFGRGHPGDATSNRAGVLVHEGQHGSDERAMGRNPVHVKEELPMERRAYEVQSQTHKALRHESMNRGLWSNSKSFTEAQRKGAVENWARQSTAAWCSARGPEAGCQ